MDYTHEGLTQALKNACDTQNAKLTKGFSSVSLHAYHAGLRDAYLKVLATIGESYTPESWTPTAGEVAPRLAPITPTAPNKNVFDRRTTVVPDEAPLSVSDILEAI